MDALLSTGALPVQSTGYDVDHSCKFESDNAESLYKDQVQGTQTTWTFSTWLKRTLEESTGKTFLIKPVILFPGWFVDSPKDSEIWVLEPKQFPYYISKKKEILSLENKKLAAYHLSRYIRAL